ncbi:hypothetical protein RVR34_09915 [Microcystis aeruginosa FBCC-A68]|uniref:hypothetical protein n=1 Tax=Microcystis aeruginosa TaxID=1126 RepID=UPI0011167B7D|nr:hypothetical protein [Microcystis aeruginosa]
MGKWGSGEVGEFQLKAQHPNTPTPQHPNTPTFQHPNTLKPQNPTPKNSPELFLLENDGISSTKS